MVRRNSVSNEPETTAPVSSVDAWPETNRRFPTFVAGLKGRWVLDTLAGTGYSIGGMMRLSVRA